MKAALCTRYGPPEVVHLVELEKPTPKPDEVLIRIHATTVTAGDWRIRSLDLPQGFRTIAPLIFGFGKPRQPVLGSECSGSIEAVGASVTRFKPGDAVFAFSGMGLRCHAQYKCMKQTGAIQPKPQNLSHEEAAALPFGGTTMLDFFRRAKLAAGEEVLVNGASGNVGTAAIQLARHAGATVTAVCSGANADLVRALGATQVIDYTKDDPIRNGETYDVIVDTAGTMPYARSKGSLNEGGRLLQVNGTLPNLLRAPFVGLAGTRRVIAGPAAERPEDLEQLAKLAASGAFRPVIDRRYPLEDIVEAHRYVDTGRKKGSVVITVSAGA